MKSEITMTKEYLIKNKTKLIIPALIQLIFLQGISGQTPANMTEFLRLRFIRYCKSVPREEVFVHTDREVYISGEDVWFNVYLIDRQSLRSSATSKIVYFELLNSENRPIVQKRILMEKGSGPGQIILPDTLSSGIYTIRAYTSWMKNFLPDNCFIKEIVIYNALSAKTFKAQQRGAGIIENRISEYKLKENNNNTVTLNINNSRQDMLELFVDTNDKFRSENGGLIYIFIQTHGNINYLSLEQITGQTTKIDIPKKTLDSGINQITLFNSRGDPVTERYIYTRNIENNSILFHINDSCGLRGKITLKFKLETRSSHPFNSANLSISVAPLLEEQENLNMEDYLITGTEFGSYIENKIQGRTISELPSGVMDSILINAQSNWIDWIRILSEELPHFKYPMENEDHVISGKLLTGDQQIIHSSEKLLMCNPGKDAKFQYSRTDNEGNFNFHIPADEAIDDIIIMPEDNSMKHKIVIESSFSDQYKKSVISINSSSGIIPPRISKLSVNRQVEGIYGIHANESPGRPVITPVKLSRFYGIPDIELILADYIKLPVMSEIFFELLPGVSLKKKKSGYEVSITEHIDDGIVVSSPTLMIDGVIISDPALIVNLDPEIVEKIDVIKGKYLVGKYFFDGIINVITRAGDFSSITLPDYMLRMSYRVADPVLSFVSPDYSTEELKESRIPDYRNTLYWNPSVKLDKDGNAMAEFWSSDNKSDYIINIQGIDSEGNIISFKKHIKVK